MTTPETKSDIGGQASSTHESRDLLAAYRLHLDVWKVQNDNYFKRYQFLMVAVQAALIAAALKVVDLNGTSGIQILVLTVLAVLGVISALSWLTLNDKQNQYMEFCRSTLRNLEYRLAELGVPLRYFTLEAHVFGPLRIEIPDLAGTAVRTEGTRHIVEFTWARERYPNQDTAKKGVHELTKVAGGMIFFERRVARTILVVWILVLIGIILATATRIGYQSPI